MAKRIKNPLELRALGYCDESGKHIEYALIRYTLSCEHNIDERKELVLLLNPEMQNVTKDFCEEAIRQVEIHEGIEEEESLLG